jgi:hypothetical protein
MSARLDALLQRPLIWRGNRPGCTGTGVIASGFAELDAQLPGGGWPRGALTEVWLPSCGIGELRLLLPALRRLNEPGRWLALVAPPHIPYAPAWQAQGFDVARLLWVRPRSAADRLWALEQTLRSGSCAAVLGWPTASPTFQQLRRLQLAAESGDTWGVLFRALRDAAQTSPAAVRVQLEPGAQGVRVELLKRRGAWGGAVVQLALAASVQ